MAPVQFEVARESRFTYVPSMSGTNKNNISVFDKYAHEYDLITNAAQREEMHTKEVGAIIARFRPESVLDAGCASGLTAALFARKGVKAVGLDRSRKMLEIARAKYKRDKLPLDFMYGNFEKLPKKLHGKFGLVVCLANSISGVGTVASLRKSLASFLRVLKPGGHLVMQLLNIDAMPENRLTPVRVTENDGLVYSRFVERRGNKLNLFVTRADLNKEPPDYEIFRHEYDSFDPIQVNLALKASKFKTIKSFADLFFSKRFLKPSRDLVIVAQKPLLKQS